MLVVENLNFKYSDKVILNNLNLEFKPGYFYSMIGVNGSGKTTFLNTLVNLLNYEGSIKLANVEIKNMKRIEIAKKIAYVRQALELEMTYTVYEIIMLARYAHLKGLFKMPMKEDHRIVEQIITDLDLSEIKNCYFNTLSGGQKQRVFLAKALAVEPEIILLDEPTNHLDLKYQLEIVSYAKKWVKKHQKIVIAVLHDLNLALRYADEVVLLNNGQKELFCKSEEIIKSPSLNEVYNIDVRKYMKESFQLWSNEKAI